MDEFVRLLIPEAMEEALEFFMESVGEFKRLSIKNSQKESSFIYENLESKLYDFDLLMIKNLMLKFYGKDYKWGTLIGVRPTKLLRRLLNLSFTFDEIEVLLKELYLVSQEKIKLLFEIVKKELKYLNNDKINVYIGIPYCPTKCKYCSFASYEMKGKLGESYDKFVETLLKEIELSGFFLRENNIEIESLYMGGGTPTSLKSEDLKRVLDKIKISFDLTKLKELTVEAGRIDTIDIEKLNIMKEAGVHRISINPQTFNEDTLKELNRFFDKKLFDEIYLKAKELGFVINMDLIIGLPKEGTEEILKTLNEIEKYDIDNLTIHVLALKKASNLYKEGHIYKDVDYHKISSKINAICESRGLKPYYMYRQKNSLEWGENVGYSLEGKESLFNIQMIEESQSTFGLGGGAITKYTNGAFDEEIEIERIVNPKEPIAYINEMEERFKKKIELFLREK